MAEFCIGGNADDLCSEFGESGILCGEVGQLSGAHKREIRWVKNEYGPFTLFFEIREIHRAELAGSRLEGFHFEIRHLFAHV